MAQTEIEGLYPLSEATPLIVRKLITEGAKANDVAKMITALNDHIVTRVLISARKTTRSASLSLLLDINGK